MNEREYEDWVRRERGRVVDYLARQGIANANVGPGPAVDAG